VEGRNLLQERCVYLCVCDEGSRLMRGASGPVKVTCRRGCFTLGSTVPQQAISMRGAAVVCDQMSEARQRMRKEERRERPAGRRLHLRRP
jgi:hypothetical protein